MSLDEAALQRLIDQDAIRATTNRYGRGCDRLDFELVRSCFTDDATADFGFFVGNVDEMIATLKPLLSNDTATTHQMLNQEYDFVSGELAHVETMVIARHRQPPRGGAPLQDAVAYGTYCDRFEKHAGEWKIAHRLLLLSPGRIDPVVVDFPFAPGGRLVPREGAKHSGITDTGNPPPTIG